VAPRFGSAARRRDALRRREAGLSATSTRASACRSFLPDCSQGARDRPSPCAQTSEIVKSGYKNDLHPASLRVAEDLSSVVRVSLYSTLLRKLVVVPECSAGWMSRRPIPTLHHLRIKRFMGNARKRSASTVRAIRLWQEVHRLHSTLGAAIEALGQELGDRSSASSGVKLADLSRRELEVMSLLREAHSAPEIADQLKVSVHTVRNHIRSIYRKVGVHSRAALLRRLQ
jgi:DNA-binding CsgD family transcriptional regulator